MKTIRLHEFASSGDAYNACQCSDDIKTGDILIIPSEKVVGLAWTWPIAVSTARGELHRTDGCLPSELPTLDDETRAAFAASEHHARALAAGYEGE